MTDRQASALHEIVSALPSGRSRRYSPALRARILDVVQAHRAQGASWAQLAEQLDVSLETLRRWCASTSRKKGAARMQRVRVVADRPASSAVSLVSASGNRVEGLTLEQVIALLQALG
jgi:transposase-like protein